MADNIANGNDAGASTPSSPGSNWGAPVHGTDSQGNDVTASFGINGREGQTLVSDGHKAHDTFMQSSQHDDYGSGNGSNNNGTSRGQYTGEGSE